MLLAGAGDGIVRAEPVGFQSPGHTWSREGDRGLEEAGRLPAGYAVPGPPGFLP